MKSRFLFPNSFKIVGWLIFIPFSILGVLYVVFEFEPHFLDLNVFAILADEIFDKDQHFSIIENNILDEIIGVLVILGALLVAFSKEKHEDEFISKIRYESLVWATYLNYAVLLFSIIFIYGLSFFWVLVFNMFTILVFFIIRTYWMISRTNKQLAHEE